MGPMRIWLDALTAKQARIASILAIEAARRGFEYVITCRDYDYTYPVLSLYGVNATCIGGHGEDARSKLVKSLERGLMLLNTVGDFDIHISLTSPDAFRVAFGLGKPSIALTDTAHAYHVNRLTLPLASRVIAPSAIPRRRILAHIPHGDEGKLITFNGVFEVMWVYRFRPDESHVKALGIEGDYVVFRFEESRASYYSFGDQLQVGLNAIGLLLRRGFKVVVFPRYSHQREAVEARFGEQVKRGEVIIPNRPVDGLQLAYYASLVVTGGSTFAVESALLGTPAVSYFPETYYTDRFIIKHGAPLIRARPKGLLNAIAKGLKMGKVGLVKGLEDPTNLILNTAEDLLNKKE